MTSLKGSKCTLCKLNLQEEKLYFEDDFFLVLRTKKLKGHKERIMIMYKRHEHELPCKVVERALGILIKIGKELFSYTPKFVIMDSTFASVGDHWHLVATDLDPESDDFKQILATRWIKVVDNTVVDESEI